MRENVLVAKFQRELFVNQLLYNCTFCLTKQFVFGFNIHLQMMKKTKQRYVALKLTSINVYTCILLNVTVSGTIFEILTSNGLYLGKTTWSPSVPPLQSQSWRWLVFYFRQEAWKWHNVVCGKREMASSFFFQVRNVDSVAMLLRTLNVLTIKFCFLS